MMSTMIDKMTGPARSPLVIVIYYAVFAALWIYLSSYVFRLNIQDTGILREFELIKGITFVAITSGLLYLLLKTSQQPGAANIDQALPRKYTKVFARRLLLLFVAMLSLIPVIVAFITFIEKPRLEQKALQERETIAELKATQIENWFKERYSDIRTLSEDAGFIVKARKLIKGNDETRQQLEERLNTFRKAYDYSSVTLLRPDREPVLNIGKPYKFEKFDWKDLASSRSSDLIHGPIFRDELGKLYLGFIKPLVVSVDNPQLVGFLLFDMSFEDFLFPYVQYLSLDNKTDETVLVREKNGMVQFISHPRFYQSEAPNLTRPLDDAEMPAAIALRQQKSGSYLGIDYRGVPVFAASHPISDFGWQLIAKIDQAEVMQPLYHLIYWVSLVGLFALLVIGISLLMVWRQQNEIHNLTLQVEHNRVDNLLQFFHDIPFIGIAITSPQSKRWLRFNDRLCEILGYSRGELQQLTWPELTHPDDLDQDVAESEKVIRNEFDGYKMDKRFIHKDGDIIYGYIEVKAIRTASGEVDYFIAMVQDISERKQVQLKLEQAHRRAQQYLDIVGSALVLLDTEHKIRLVNRKAREILGYSERALLGNSWFEQCLPESQQKKVKAVFNKLMAGEIESTEYIENWIVTRSGQQRLIAWHNSILYDDQGEIIGILSSGEDITDMRATQEELEASQFHLRALIQTIPDLIWLKDANGSYLNCNAIFERFFGASEAEIVGKTDYDFVDRKLADFFREHDRKAIAAGKPCRNEEILTFPDGHWGTFETTKSPMFDSHGKLIGVLGIAHDITERKEAAARIAQLSRLYATLGETNQAIVRIKQENKLLAQICRNAVEYGGYKMAWIGIINSYTQMLTPVASTGVGVEFLNEISLSLDPQKLLDQGPVAIALREARPYWCQDCPDNVETATWLEQAKVFGFGASASLPIWRNGKVYGCFNLHSEQANSFDKDAQKLLQEMAADITFALDNFDRERERQATQQRLDLVIQASNDAPWDWDLVNNEPYYSPQWWHMLGYEVDELPADSELWRQLAHPEDLPLVEQSLYRIQQPGHERESVECRFQHKDGNYVPTIIRSIVSRDRGGNPVRLTGTVTDLTDQKATEVQLRDQLDELNRWFATTIDREERIMELKEEVNALLQQHQQAPRYNDLEKQDG